MTSWTSCLTSLPTPSKEVRQFLQRLERIGGWEGRKTSAGHVYLRFQNRFMDVAATPRSPRSITNALAAARRIDPRMK